MNYDHAQLADLAPVVNNLSGVTRYELQAAGVDPNMLVRLLIDGIERGKAYAIYQDDIPIAIFWFYPSLFEAETSFIATQAFFDRPMASIRTSQEVLGCPRGLPEYVFGGIYGQPASAPRQMVPAARLRGTAAQRTRKTV